MSKAALNMLTRLVQNLVAEKGIKVLSIHPGWLRTQMGGKNADLSPQDVAKLIIQKLTEGQLKDLPIYMDYTGKKMNW
jgi:NAD(P)-dependent dehydrogenase (short-subunit alcohol dehydrogenase family)